jgi:hypothetical protein
MSAEQFAQPVNYPPHPPGLPPAEGWPVHPAMVSFTMGNFQTISGPVDRALGDAFFLML